MLSITDVSLGNRLKNITFSIDSESLCIVSCDGSPLTSLADVITGIKLPSSGCVTGNGNIPLLTEGAPLPEHMKSDGLLKTVTSLTEATELSLFVYENSKDLSGRRIASLDRYERVRLGVLALISTGAEYIFAEAPTRALDPEQSERILSLLLSDAHGSYPIYTPETLSDISKADKLLAIDRGRAVFFGMPDEFCALATARPETVVRLMGDKKRISELLGAFADGMADTELNNVTELTVTSMTEKEIKERLRGSGITLISSVQKNEALRVAYAMLTESGEKKLSDREERIAKTSPVKKIDISLTAFNHGTDDDPYEEDDDEEGEEESTIFGKERR